MARPSSYPAREYARVGLETDVTAADPHRMVLMLFDGALRAVRDAERHLAARSIAAKGEAISRAITIVELGLRRSVDMKHGGSLPQHLNDLYEYINRRLLMVSLHNDTAALAEVGALLATLRGAWAEIGEHVAARPPAFVPTTV